MPEALATPLEHLRQGIRDGALPAPASVCIPCCLPGALFSLAGKDGCDHLAGIPSEQGVGPQWFRDNRWIRDRTRNFRDTFLQQVFEHAGSTLGEAWLAEFLAFVSVEKIQLLCLDEHMEHDDLAPPILDHMAVRTHEGLGFALQRNFFFANDTLFYASFTHARWDEAPRGEYLDAQGERRISPPYTWRTPEGCYPVDKACAELALHFTQAKAQARVWRGVLGAGEAALGVLAMVPVVRGIKGATTAGRYAFLALEAALAADAMVDGSSRMITGDGLSIGEQFFTELARLANPATAEERGKQVFMAINLALLLPAAFGGARWLMHKLRPGSVTTVQLDNAALTQEQVRRLGNRSAGEVTLLETRIERRADDSGLRVRASELHSTERNASLISLEANGARADYAYMANTLRDRLVAMILHSVGPVRMGGSLSRVVAEAGEEALAEALIKHWNVRPENILGLSTRPDVPSRFGLKNRSDQGIDMLVYVPPPPSMTVRNPTTQAMRHHIDGLKGTAPLEELTFEPGTLLVIEVKTTLGKSKTPGFLKTQAGGGEKNIKRINELITYRKQGWDTEKLKDTDPQLLSKVKNVRTALKSKKIAYIHAQVFFSPRGKPNTITSNHLGIQINKWN